MRLRHGEYPFSPSLLVVVQERSSLLVLSNNSLSSAEASTEDLGESNDNGGDEEGGHDGEGKDPLEGNDLSEELADTQGGAENTKGKANGVVL